jgi:hypothetical protein
MTGIVLDANWTYLRTLGCERSEYAHRTTGSASFEISGMGRSPCSNDSTASVHGINRFDLLHILS